MPEAINKQVFVVVATRNADAIEGKIRELEIPFLAIKSDAWMLVYGGTSRELGDTLGIRNGEVGTGMVFAVNNYSGRASPDIWEWLKVNWPQNA